MVFATQTLTVTGQPLDTETVVVGGKTYTFQATLTNVDGNVKIGADAATSLANLKAAVNLGAGAGTAYATAMTANLKVVATTLTATTLVFSAQVPGDIGNLIASTETLTNGSFGAGLLAGGSGNIATDIRTLLAAEQVNASVAQKLVDMVDPQSDE